jgi:cold shock CspA family protein
MTPKIGTVKFYDSNPRVGYGFVAGDDGKDYFVHPRCLVGGVIPHKGDRVSFVAGPAVQGRSPEAREVEVIAKGPAFISNDPVRRAVRGFVGAASARR